MRKKLIGWPLLRAVSLSTSLLYEDMCVPYIAVSTAEYRLDPIGWETGSYEVAINLWWPLTCSSQKWVYILLTYGQFPKNLCIGFF